MPRIFPDVEAENFVICITGLGESAGFSCLISKHIPNFHFIAGSQCFPLYLYDEVGQALGSETPDMFSATTVATKRHRREAITDGGLRIFKETYPREAIEKEDIFYYVYGLLHSTDYRERYADNLSKELPRIPHVKTAADFWAFSQAGRALAEYHLNYETVQPHPLTIEAKGPLTDDDYRVEKMKFAKKGDKTTVIYNGKITIKDIPETAWDYVVNGKAALDWVMERQRVKIDKDSGIVNDANDWAIETMGNPKYPLELFQRVVTVSLETQKIVAALPKLDI
jgi:predicted helicase